MPMQKTSTQFKTTDLTSSFTQTHTSSQDMHPSSQTIRNIMQFASNYRVQKVNNQFLEFYLS